MAACRPNDVPAPPWPAPPRLPIFAGDYATGGRLLHKVDADYPESLRRNYPQEVRVRCKIDESGRIVQADVEAGPAELRPFAIAAVREWRYEPVRL